MSDRLAPSGRLRKLTARDAPLLRRFLVGLDAETRRARFHGAVGDAFLETHAAGCLARGVVYGLFVDDRLAGVGELALDPDRAGGRAEAAFVVAPAARRRGVAGRLMTAVLRSAANRGCRTVTLLFARDNWAMRRLALTLEARLALAFDVIEAEVAVPPATGLSLLRETMADLADTMVTLADVAAATALRGRTEVVAPAE